MFPFTLRESFDRDNPWFGQITGLAGTRRRLLEAMRLAVLAACAAAFAALWGWALARRDSDLLRLLAHVSYTVMVVGAFMAPAVGASARARFDHSPLAKPSFLTPLGARSVLVAMHGRLLLATLSAGAFAAVVLGGLVALAATADPAFAQGVNWTLLNMAVFSSGLWEIIRGELPRATGVPLAAAVAVAALANFCAGVYLRGSLLARQCQVAPDARLNGGLLTALLIALMMLSFMLRFGATRSIDAYAPWPVAPLVFLLAMESGLAAGRFTVARQAWATMERDGMEDTRRWLFEAEGKT